MRQTAVLTFSPNNAYLLAAGGPELDIFEVATGDTQLIKNTRRVNVACFSSDGSQVIEANEHLSVYDLDGSRGVASLKFGPLPSTLRGLGNFTEDSSALVTILTEKPGDEEETVAIVDTKSHAINRFESLGRNNMRAMFLPGSRLIAGGSDGVLKVHDIGSGETRHIETSNVNALPLAVVKRLKVVMIGFDVPGRPYAFYDMNTWERVLDGKGAWSECINFTSDERYVICPSNVHPMDTIPIRRVALNATFLEGDLTDEHSESDIVYTEDGKVLGLWRGRVWDALANEVIFDQDNSPLWYNNEASLLPGGRRLISGEGSYLTLWDLETVTPVMTKSLKSRGWQARHSISPDGNVIAVTSWDGHNQAYVQFWRAPSWEEIEAAEK